MIDDIPEYIDWIVEKAFNPDISLILFVVGALILGLVINGVRGNDHRRQG